MLFKRFKQNIPYTILKYSNASLIAALSLWQIIILPLNDPAYRI